MTFPIGLFALGLVLAAAYLTLTNRAQSWPRSIAKTLPLALFALCTWIVYAPAYLTAALALSALGDLALSREGRAAFLYGLASFSLAHLLYILLFSASGAAPAWDALAHAPLAAAVLVALMLSTELWLAPHTGGLKGPVRLYVMLIGVMGLSALSLPDGFGAVRLGAGLFILSDMILAIRLFRLAPGDPRAARASLALWLFYIAGQALILYGLQVF
ncbi:MAG: lysoplasmalogenase [Rhodobacteraceae bacterium]|nr:lysoplasmalogenase [Paracoccaceae bacterium]